jgi:outer membrane lipoprotein-sorting protein
MRRTVACLLAALCALGPLAAPRARAEGATLDGLLAEFAAMPGLRATFHEEKHIALLEEPLVSEGTLHFAPPGRLARHVTSPSPSSVVIDGDKLLFGDAKGTRELDLAARPPVRAFVDAFVKLLAGDKPALERLFAAELEPGKAGWRLVLRPKSSPLKDVFDRLEAEGAGVVLSRLGVYERSGDSTETTFRDVDATRAYAPDELERVFRVQK